MKQTRKQLHMAKRTAGFTLIEVLIAVVIFSSSLAGMLLLVGTGIGNVNVAKDRLIANYLAQEGIELLRYKRDYMTVTNGSSGWNNFTGLFSAIGDTTINNFPYKGPFGVSPIHPLDTPKDCGSNDPTACQIVVDQNGSAATGAYTIKGDAPASWTPTKFTRKLYLGGTNSVDSYVIISEVTWSDANQTYSVKMSETLYNWL